MTTMARFHKLRLVLERRLPVFRKAFAVLLAAIVVLQGVLFEGVPLWAALPFLAVVTGYYFRPERFRLALVSTIAVSLIGMVVFAHVYFRTILMVPVILFIGMGLVGVILTIYGRGPAAFLAGVGLSIGSTLAFPENPLFTSPIPEAECLRAVNALEDRLAPWAAPRLSGPHLQHIPRKPEWPTADPHYVLEVGPAGTSFGRPLPSDPREASRQLGAVIGATSAPWPPVYLAADEQEPLSKIATLLKGLPPVDLLILAIKGPGPLGAPPDGAMGFASERASLPMSDHGRLIALELSRRVGPCRLASDELARLGEVPLEERARLLIERLSEGLRDCQCSYVDLGALEYVMAAALDVPEFEYSAKKLERTPQGELLIPDTPGKTFGEWVATLR